MKTSQSFHRPVVVLLLKSEDVLHMLICPAPGVPALFHAGVTIKLGHFVRCWDFHYGGELFALGVICGGKRFA